MIMPTLERVSMNLKFQTRNGTKFLVVKLLSVSECPALNVKFRFHNKLIKISKLEPS